MQSVQYKLIEFFLIFIILPISFTFNYAFQVKLVLGFLGFMYVLYILIKVNKNTFKIDENINWTKFWRHIIIKFLIIAIVTTSFVWFTDKQVLFNVVLNKPKLWVIILLVYSFLSVFPQELIYRTFYFQRYKNLFSNEKLFIFVNAIEIGRASCRESV